MSQENVEVVQCIYEAWNRSGGVPPLEFIDPAIETEFVAIPRPLERSATPDGGPLAYRITHSAPLWKAGERPKLEQRVLEGDPRLSI